MLTRNQNPTKPTKPEGFVDEFLVMDKLGGVVGRFSNAASFESERDDDEGAQRGAVQQAAALPGGTVLRVRLRRTKQGATTFTDYDNPIEEEQVYPVVKK